jgi:hypothetical protein
MGKEKENRGDLSVMLSFYDLLLRNKQKVVRWWWSPLAQVQFQSDTHEQMSVTKIRQSLVYRYCGGRALRKLEP